MRAPGPFPVLAASELVTSMGRPCSIAVAVSIAGEKWMLLVLREAFPGVTRFDEFLCRMGCSSIILSSRLKALAAYDILHRVPYQEPDDRVRNVYRLTQADADLLPAIVTLTQWGDRCFAPDGEGSMLLYDRESDILIHVTLVNALGGPVAPKNSMHERSPRYRWGENRAIAATDTPPANG